MNPQAFDLLMDRLDRIEDKIDANSKFRQKLIGMVIGISFVTSASTSKIVTPPPVEISKKQVEQIMEGLKDENI